MGVSWCLSNAPWLSGCCRWSPGGLMSLFLLIDVEVCLIVNICHSGYLPSLMMWLLESWGQMGQAIDRTETESSAVLLCRAGHTVRQLNRCRAQEPAVSPALSFACSPHVFTTSLPFSPRTKRVLVCDHQSDPRITLNAHRRWSQNIRHGAYPCKTMINRECCTNLTL